MVAQEKITRSESRKSDNPVDQDCVLDCFCDYSVGNPLLDLPDFVSLDTGKQVVILTWIIHEPRPSAPPLHLGGTLAFSVSKL